MYGKLFSEDLLEGFSDPFLTDPRYVPAETDSDEDFIVARGIVPHGATVLGAQRPNCISHRGERFGSLTVLYDHLSKSGEKSRRVHCRCVCGTEKDIDYDTLKSGDIISCGCFLRSKQSLEHKTQVKKAYWVRQKSVRIRKMEETDPVTGDVCRCLRCVGTSKMCGKYRFVPCVCSRCGKLSWYTKRGFIHGEADCTCSYRWKKRTYGKWELHPDSFGLTKEDVTRFLSENPFQESYFERSVHDHSTDRS